jgi:hypothetical protein
VAGSGIEPETGEWTPAFEGQRPPFQPENTLAVRHGARGTVTLEPRAHEIADELRALVPGYAESDEIVVRTLSFVLARIEKTSAALAEAKPDELASLEARSVAWVNAARRLLNDLGMTPSARAKLGLSVARGAREAEEALRRHVDQHYGDDSEQV